MRLLRQLLFLLLLLFSLLSTAFAQSYEITEEQLTTLETTIANQKISIDKQAILLTSSQEKITKLEDLTTLSEKIIKQQETLLNKSESKSWIDSVKTFFIGLLTGSCIVTILYLTNV